MKFRVKTRPESKADKGGYLCMPLRQYVPHPTDKRWKLVICPECRRECWDRPLPKEFEGSGVEKLCTECVLKKNQRGEKDDEDSVM